MVKTTKTATAGTPKVVNKSAAKKATPKKDTKKSIAPKPSLPPEFRLHWIHWRDQSKKPGIYSIPLTPKRDKYAACSPLFVPGRTTRMIELDYREVLHILCFAPPVHECSFFCVRRFRSCRLLCKVLFPVWRMYGLGEWLYQYEPCTQDRLPWTFLNVMMACVLREFTHNQGIHL